MDSHYQRLHRCFRSFEFDPDPLARLLVRRVSASDGPWRRTPDRTHGTFGRVDINFLVLGIAYCGIAPPIFWSVLNKAGQSNTAERIALMERLPRGLRRGTDRRPAGRPRIRGRGGVPVAASATDFLPPAPQMRHPNPQPLEPEDPGRCLVGRTQTRPSLPAAGAAFGLRGFAHLLALRLDDGELRILATFGAPQDQAIDAYADRWQAKTLFGCLKTRGFNFEDTHLGDAARLSNMRGLFTLAFAWTHRAGEQLRDRDLPISFKKRFGNRSSLSSSTASIFFVTSSSTSPTNSRISSGP